MAISRASGTIRLANKIEEEEKHSKNKDGERE